MGSLRNRGTAREPQWYARFRDEHGVRREINTRAMTKAEATTFLVQIEARITRGEQGIVTPTKEDRARRALTVAELAARFLGDVEGEPGYAPPRIKSVHNYRRQARSVFKVHVVPALGARPAASVRASDVEALRDHLLAEDYAAETAGHVMATLSKVFNWARKTGLVTCANPVADVERPRPAASLDFLDAAEVGRLLSRAEADAVAATGHEECCRWPMIATAVYAGLRKGELFGLRWCDVALDAIRLDVLHSYRLAPKNGKARHVPAHPELVRALRWWRDRCPATSEGLVFPVQGAAGFYMGESGDMLGLPSILAAAGCHGPADGKPWHMLRHTFAASAVMMGVSLYTVQKFLGHASLAMTQRYAHLAPDYLAREVARMAFPAPAIADVADLAEERRRRAAERIEP